ncbi:MAG: VanW family protein [Clostridia bacterium]|nr:VanW family protein [Clostridia bacterium]MBR3553056.1 VanW family protein [Clostridia bacterium]
MARKLFCEWGPVCYWLSLQKEIVRRNLRDAMSKEQFAKEKRADPLPNIVKSHTSVLVRRLHGVDLTLQENKVTNIRLACEKVNGLIIRPGETFSFWRTIGKTDRRAGYLAGMTIKRGAVGQGIGGGLCQMANMVHWLVLNSPLTDTELHHHSDALFPDERRRVPFGTGTSVFYNNVDYRFKNTTDQCVQLLTWIEGGELCGELRSETPFPYRYKIVEENHHFRKEGDDYYRISQVYQLTIDRDSGETVEKKLVLDNHSKVMYDHALIPPEQIRNDEC